MDNNELEQFLCDVCEHFKASLETSEYENSSNLFHVTEAEATAKLLTRCELLLQKYNKTKKPQQQQNNAIQSNDNKMLPVLVEKNINDIKKLNGHSKDYKNELEISYLDMSGNYSKKKSASHEYMDFHHATDSEKTFRCLTCIADACEGKNFAYVHESLKNEDDDAQIYDTCVVSQYSLNESEINSSYEDCPFMSLPAGHLAINKSIKYGQLQRIEKRLFFDQCKKCFCGILNDWLLCYDDPTASSPSITLYLKTPGIEIEHAGEGKRRDICFQITTDDPNKKFIFQANNEVDAKEWIHAIEAVKSDLKQNRRLPTPPVMKKITFVGHGNIKNTTVTPTSNSDQNDCIYEEPSPIYDAHTPNEHLLEKLPEESNNTNIKFFEYDIPKLPAKPVEKQQHVEEDKSITSTITSNLTETETSILLNVAKEEDGASSPTNSPKIRQSLAELADKIDFQAKVKDLHSKLSSQLLSPTSPYQDRMLKKTVRKTYSDSSNDSAESMALTRTPTAKDQKKQKTTSTPQTIPQKNNNNNVTNNNINNNNNNNEKTTKSWFLTRFQKTTSSMRNSTINTQTPTFAKCRQSEQENLLNCLDPSENNELSNSPSSPILKNANETADTTCGNKSKVNMIINQLEASGGHLAMFSMEAMSNLSSAFYDNHDCGNNYEPIMKVSSPPSSFLKKV